MTRKELQAIWEEALRPTPERENVLKEFAEAYDRLMRECRNYVRLTGRPIQRDNK